MWGSVKEGDGAGFDYEKDLLALADVQVGESVWSNFGDPGLFQLGVDQDATFGGIDAFDLGLKDVAGADAAGSLGSENDVRGPDGDRHRCACRGVNSGEGEGRFAPKLLG